MNKDDAERKIRRAAREGRVVFAPSDGIEQFGPLCDEFIYRVFSIRGAFVSDESALSDFSSKFGLTDAEFAKEKARMFAKIERVYGVDARKCVYVIDALRLIYSERQNRGTA